MTRRNIRWLLYGAVTVVLGVAGFVIYSGGDGGYPAPPSGTLRDHSNTQPIVSPIRNEAPPRKAAGADTPDSG